MREVRMDSIAEMIAEFYMGLAKRGVPPDHASILTRVVLETFLDASREMLARSAREKDGFNG